VWWIRQSILAEIDRNLYPVRLPNNVSGNNRKVKAALDNFYTQNGRMPNNFEYAEFEIGSHIHIQVSSLDSKLSEESDSAYAWELMPDPTPMPDNFSENEHLTSQISGLLNRLSEKHRLIVAHKYGVCGYEKLNTPQIAAILKTTPKSVEQIARNAIQKIRRNAKQN
jgi:RNA polymerase sigma factor (sigma-70 family)